MTISLIDTMANRRQTRVKQALQVLSTLGMPRGQINERSALCLLALLDLTPKKNWADAVAPLLGITPIMDWIAEHYLKQYAPNSRETVRRQTMHQFVQGGVALYNPDMPNRPVNSPLAVYQITPECLQILRLYGTESYAAEVGKFLRSRGSLVQRYAMGRELEKVPLRLASGRKISLSPGRHSELIRAIYEEFGPRFIPVVNSFMLEIRVRSGATSTRRLLPACALSWMTTERCPMSCFLSGQRVVGIGRSRNVPRTCRCKTSRRTFGYVSGCKRRFGFPERLSRQTDVHPVCERHLLGNRGLDCERS